MGVWEQLHGVASDPVSSWCSQHHLSSLVFFFLPPSTHSLQVSNTHRNILYTLSETDKTAIIPPSHVGFYPKIWTQQDSTIQFELMAEISGLWQDYWRHVFWMLQYKQRVSWFCPLSSELWHISTSPPESALSCAEGLLLQRYKLHTLTPVWGEALMTKGTDGQSR